MYSLNDGSILVLPTYLGYMPRWVPMYRTYAGPDVSLFAPFRSVPSSLYLPN